MSEVVIPSLLKASELDNTGFISNQVKQLETCGHFVYSIECHNCHTKHFSGFSRCRNRHCVPCNHTKTLQVLARLMPVIQDWIQKGNYVSMLNFTIKDTEKLGPGIEKLNNSFRSIYNSGYDRKVWKSRFPGGIRSLEVKIGKNSDLWHPHIHCLILQPGGSYKKDYFWIKERWKSITDDSGSVWIKKVKGENLIKAACETLKYIIKPDMNLYNDPERYRELILTLRGIRQFNTWGLLRGLNDDKEDFESATDKKIADFVCQLCGCTEGELTKMLYKDNYNKIFYDL